MKRRLLILCAVLCLITLPPAGCGDGGAANRGADGKPGVDNQGKPMTIAYLTNGVDPFWDIAAGGVKTADADFADVTTLVRMPPNATVEEQKTYIEAWLAQGVDGIAISPIDAENQVEMINTACEFATVITQDSDAPKTNRQVFIGVDNYKAGREAGKLVKSALPDGGSVIIFVGRLEQLNARQRRQGVIDELLDRPKQKLGEIRYDANDATNLTAADSKYVIIDTRTDSFDKARAKQNAEDAISRYENLGCMVGLFAYNPPACLLAVKGADKTGKIKLVGFDEDADTLQGIADGHIEGTVSQQPHQYGYESVRVLRALIRGDKSVIPANKFIEMPAKVVTKENVVAFRDELKRLMELGKQ